MRIFSHIGISEDVLRKKYTTKNNDGLLVDYSANHPEGLVINMPFVGQGHENANAQGWLRNRTFYFKELLLQRPEIFSPENTELINNNKSPYVDAKLIQHFPQYEGYEGDRLIHHHIGENGQSVALPSSIHKGYGEIHNVEKEIGVTNNAQAFSNEWQSEYNNGENPTWARFLATYSNETKENNGLYEQNKESIQSDPILPAKIDSMKEEKVELNESIESINEEHALVEGKTPAEGSEQKEEAAQTAAQLNEEYTPAEDKTQAEGYSPIGCTEKTAEAEPTENTQLNLGQASTEEEALAEKNTPAEGTKQTTEITHDESNQLNKGQTSVEDEAPTKVTASAESTGHTPETASTEATKLNEDYTPTEDKVQAEGNSPAEDTKKTTEGTQLNVDQARAEGKASNEPAGETVPVEETTTVENPDKSQDAGEDNASKRDYYSGYTY